MIFQTEKNIQEKEKDQEGDEKENKISQTIDMMDQLLSFTENSKIKALTKFWRYSVRKFSIFIMVIAIFAGTLK